MAIKHKLEQILIGGLQNRVFEDRLTILTALIISIISLIASIINIALGLGVITYITFAGVIIGFLLYIAGRSSKKIDWIRWAVNIFVLAYLDIAWFYNHGSSGPILYVYILYYALIIFAWSGFIRKALFVIYIINTIVIFYIELNYLNLLGDYESAQIRIIDVYSGIFMYLICSSILFINLKNNLVKERERARQSDRLKSAFLSNLSHEIRTPMNAIMGFSSLLYMKKNKPEKTENYLKLIHKNANYLMNLMNDILDISMLESNQIELVYNNFKVSDLFEEIKLLLAKFKSNIKSDVTIEHIVKGHNLIIYSDRTRIKEILINLLTNAIKFTESGEIVFSCEKLNTEYLFTVKDSGIGINEKDKAEIFEMFNKINPDDNKEHRGTGLGLSLAKRLIEKLNGSIWLESSPEKGSTFYFTIPVKQ